MALRPEDVRRVLVYRIGSLGDTIVALPALHQIARCFPHAERRLLTNFPIEAKAPAASVILGDSGLVHGYMRYAIGTRSLSELLRLRKEIRAFNPDVLVYLMPLRPPLAVLRDHIFFRLAGIRQIHGLPGAEELRYGFDPATGLHESEASRLARSIRTLGAVNLSDAANWDLQLSDVESQKAHNFLAPHQGRSIICCGPGTKMQCKDWGAERWAKLLKRLSRQLPDHLLLMVGSAQEFDECEQIAASWQGEKVNLCGQFSPREVVPLLAASRVYLGTDSGQMHLAACVGTPCACVFAARNLPGIWFPPGDRNRILYHKTDCYNCLLATCIDQGKKCIYSITVDEMAHAVGEILHLPTLQIAEAQPVPDTPELKG